MADNTASLNNVIIDVGGTNEFTLLSTNVEEIREKVELTEQVLPTTTSTASSNNTVDLLKISSRFTFKGFIERADKSKLRNVFYTKGPVTMTNYDGEDFDNADVIHTKFQMQKYSMVKTNTETEQLTVIITGFLANKNLA